MTFAPSRKTKHSSTITSLVKLCFLLFCCLICCTENVYASNPDVSIDYLEVVQNSTPNPAKISGTITAKVKVRFKNAANQEIEPPSGTAYDWSCTGVTKDGQAVANHNVQVTDERTTTMTCSFSDAGNYTISLSVVVTNSAWPTNFQLSKSINLSAQVASLILSILEPNDQPITDNNFSFDGSATGIADVVVKGKADVTSENPGLSWSLSSISGSTLSSNPNPPKGADVTFSYTGLPSSNSQFGNKTLTLSHPKASTTKTQTIKMFFSGSDTATNHPGAGAGVTPNWFFYWSQTTAAVAAVFSTNVPPSGGVTTYEGGTWVAKVGLPINDNYTPRAEGVNGGIALTGIDTFAYTSRHEARHVATLSVWYPNDYNNGVGRVGYQSTIQDPNDQDGDLMPDALEAGYTAAANGPFDPNTPDTDGDGLSDSEEYVVATQNVWTVGSADSADWSSAGHQWYK